jgi:uncharacterized protein YndB with AHSA1/START domain
MDDDPLLRLDVTVSEHVPAPRGQVFALLTDVERMAGLGPEHEHARWQDSGLALGAVFLGRNRRGEQAWELPCTVVVLDPPSAFGWVVGELARPTTRWTYALVDDKDGTRVTQRVQHGPGWSFLRDAVERRPERAEQYIVGRAIELETNMRTVLHAAARLLT